MLPVFHEVLRQANVRNVNQEFKNRRKQLRDGFNLDSIPDERFRELFRINKPLFNHLCASLTPHLRRTTYSSAVSADKRILTALRFYATGCYQRAVGEDFHLGVSQTCVHRYIHEVTEAIDQHLSERYIKFPRTRREINENKQIFMDRFNFPGVLGAVDGTHVAILKPAVEEHNFINRKGYHSLNVQILCNADLRILSINSNYPGSTHDAFIWRNSQIREHLNNQYLLGQLRGSWLIGDSGYPLEPILMTPYLNVPEDSPESRYNQAHARARNCVERCIGLLKMRFRCLMRERVARYAPNFVGRLVNACTVLHNLCLDFGLNVDNENINNIDNDEYNVGNNPYLVNEGHRIRQNIVNNYFQM